MPIVNVIDKNTASHINKLELDFNSYISIKDKYLYLEKGFLKLFHKNKELCIDFNNSNILNRINPKTKKCNIVQAVEGRSKNKLSILDTTAGLGKDFFTLAARKHQVVAIEKDPYIFLLLSDALRRAKKFSNLASIVKNICLKNTDSSDYILSTDHRFDCIYVDPMFPARQKSAKTKQQIQLLNEIIDNNELANEKLLSNILLSRLANKVIVKRPINGPFLSNKNPSAQLKGKANRFDIYSL